MIKDDDRVEFIFEKVIQEPSDEDSGTSVELFVKYDADGPFGPTVGFTEELEPSNRAKAEWTYLPLSFIKEVAEYLHAKGAIEKLEGARSAKATGSKALPNPVLASPKSSGGNLNLPQVNKAPLSPINYSQNPGGFSRPAQPTQGPQQPSYGPQIRMGANGVEIQNSHPPYQQPVNNQQMYAQPETYQLPNESTGFHHNTQATQIPAGMNPFGNNLVESQYQNPIQSFSGMMSNQPQPPQQQQFEQPQVQPAQYQQPSPNNLTAMLNEDVQDTPPHLKGQAVDMLQQRAAALNKQINGVDKKKIKPMGSVHVDPSTLVTREQV